MGNQIFISYAHKDKNLAKELADELKEEGLHPWFDEYELRPGESWENQLRNGLEKCNLLIVLYSAGEPSPNVLFEAGVALAKGTKVVIISPEKGEPNKELQSTFASIIKIDHEKLKEEMESKEEIFREIAEKISKILEKESLTKKSS
ncbi:MAG: toll/interleukin-1 receptor domain-containing protein [Methylococcaceae bacterium]|jgi:hypothetical protein